MGSEPAEPQRTAWQNRHGVTAATDQEVVEQAVDDLLERLEKWIKTQKEWPLVCGLGNRVERRRLEKRIAHYLTTIPLAEAEFGNRALRRAIARSVGSMVRT